MLKLIGYLNDAHDDLMRISVAVDKAELHHRVILAEVIFDVRDLVVKLMFFDLFLQDLEGICKIDFERARIVG